MAFSKILFFVAVSSIIILGGCSISQFETNGRSNTSGVSYPIQQMSTPEIMTDLSTSKTVDTSAYEKEDSRSNEQMANLELPNGSGSANLFPASIAGVWNLSIGNKICRIATPQTKFGQGYRAGPLNCPGIISQINSWAIKGKRLYFYDNSGRAVVTLYSSNVDHFKGRTLDGHPVILSR
ncbi:AprI/Inh family metalloprotease inhibitor [Bartonella sp. B35(2025)]